MIMQCACGQKNRIDSTRIVPNVRHRCGRCKHEFTPEEFFIEFCTEQTRQQVASLKSMEATLVGMHGQQFYDDLLANAEATLRRQEVR